MGGHGAQRDGAQQRQEDMHCGKSADVYLKVLLFGAKPCVIVSMVKTYDRVVVFMLHWCLE